MNYFIKIIAIGFIIIALTGCSIKFNSSGSAGAVNNGGIYKTINKGDTWFQKSLIPTIAGKPGTIGGLDVSCLAIDLSDSKAIYFGSVDNGLFYTYDGGENWQAAKSLGNDKTIDSIVVDPKAKCIIYVSSGNRIFKSTDCNRTWTNIYYDNNLSVKITDLSVDFADTAKIIAVTSRGEVLRSSDRGESWQAIYRFKDGVKQIAMSPYDSRILFAAAANDIYRSDDGGNNWKNLKDNLKDFGNSLSFKDFVFANSEKGLVFIAGTKGILKSTNSGETWSDIKLLTTEKDAIVNALAISPKDPKEIYYATRTTFYRSVDGGENWSTKKLPTTRAGWKLLIDPADTKVIYMGVMTIK